MISTCSGFILSFRSIKRTESPTTVWLHIIRTIFCNEENRTYFNKTCAALGYDFMCTMVKRLLGKKIETMFKNGDRDVHLLYYIIIKKFGLQRLFIDIFHGINHKYLECKSKEGTFYPKNEKYKQIGFDINRNVVEQYWSQFNKLKFLKSYTSDKFGFSLFLVQELHNFDLKRR